MPGPEQFEFGSSGSSRKASHRRKQSSSGTPIIIGIFLMLGLVAIGVAIFFGTRSSEQPKTVASKTEESIKTPTDSSSPKETARINPVAKKPSGKAPGDTSSPKSKILSWKIDAEGELRAALRITPEPEPLSKRQFMTDLEYLRAVNDARFFIMLHATEDYPDEAALGHLSDTQFFEGDRSLIPRSLRVVEREAIVRIARSHSDKMIQDLVNTGFSGLRVLLDKDAKKLLLENRLPLKRRKELYSEFAETTGDKRKWSLLHPFDDLTGQMMTDVVGYCRLAKANGLGSLDHDARLLILTAGATDFFKQLLESGK